MAGWLAFVEVVALVTHVNTGAAWVLALDFIARHARLIVALRAFCNEHQDDWDDYLDMLELGFNSAEQASTKHSPFEMIYGMRPRLPIDVALADFEPKNPAAIDRAARMFQAVEAGRSYLLTAQDRQARNADRHRRPLTFKVGDAVLLSTEGLQLKRGTNKLCSRYIGPFPVTAVVNRNAYTLQLPNQLGALHPTFNIEKLKAYRDGRGLFPGSVLRRKSLARFRALSCLSPLSMNLMSLAFM